MSNLMICKYDICRRYLVDPVELPCYNNVCQCHVAELIGNLNTGDRFQCFVCNQQHEIPQNGFKSKGLVMEPKWPLTAKCTCIGILLLIAMSISFFGILKKQQNLFATNMSSDLMELKEEMRSQSIENSRQNEKNLFDEMMMTSLKTNEDYFKKILKQLNDFNEHQKSYLENLSINLASNLKEELVTFKKLYDFNENQKSYLANMSSNFSSNLREELVNLESFSTNPSSLISKQSFYKNENIMVKLESSILTLNQSIELIKLCKFDDALEFKLLYRASKDGFESESFHDKCDAIPNTLTIIKVKGSSNIFGGFASLYWDSFSRYKTDSHAFIFSLINKANQPFKINVNLRSKAILCDPKFGPSFGHSSIVIANNSNLNQESYSSLDEVYPSSQYPYLAGFFNFSTEDIEVYQVISCASKQYMIKINFFILIIVYLMLNNLSC